MRHHCGTRIRLNSLVLRHVDLVTGESLVQLWVGTVGGRLGDWCGIGETVKAGSRWKSEGAKGIEARTGEVSKGYLGQKSEKIKKIKTKNNI